MKQGMLSSIATGILTVCAIVVTGVLVHREFFAASPTSSPATKHISTWREIAAEGQSVGSDSAPVVITEFSDFQCVWCQRLAGRIDSVVASQPTRIRVVFRHYPSEAHASARAAALASECAGYQQRFWPYYELLFSVQDSIGKIPWTVLAARSGVRDTVGFSRCFRDSVVLGHIKRDVDVGNTLGVAGTPGLLVNGEFMVGTPSRERLQDLVDKALKDAAHHK